MFRNPFALEVPIILFRFVKGIMKSKNQEKFSQTSLAALWL